MRAAALVAAVLALGPAGPSRQDAAVVLERAARAYDSVTTLRASFVQTVTNPMISAPDSSQGTLFLVRPDKFAMRFAQPRGDRIVADGEWLWLYFPSTVERQVVRTAIPAGGPAGPNLFAQFVERPLLRYRATYLSTEEVAGAPHDLVRLEPKDAGLGFRSAIIAVGRADGLIRVVDLVEGSGLRRRLELAGVTLNAPVPPIEVSFSPPQGVRVITQP